MANNRGDIVLHINPRVHDRQLVLNSAPGGGWGAEERKPLTISTGDPFHIVIMVTEQNFQVSFTLKDNKTKLVYCLINFKIAINNQHAADYNHRLPLTAAELVTVKGDVTLTDVRVYPGFAQYGHPWQFAMVSIHLYISICSLSECFYLFIGNSSSYQCFSW